MKHEKIVRREDGTQYKIIINFLSDWHRDTHKYDYDVWVRSKGQKKWRGISNSDDYTWRALSMDNRRKFNEDLYLKHVTIEEVQQACLELWETLKPKLT